MSTNMKNAATGAMNAVPSNAYSRPIAVFLFRIPRIVNMKETIGKLSSGKENKIIVNLNDKSISMSISPHAHGGLSSVI